MTQHSVPVNPIVRALIQQGVKGIIELTGYPGPCEEGSVRIYRDLSLTRYVEMSQDEVLYFSEPEDPQEACKILFKRTANLKYVKRAQPSRSASAISSITVSADETKRGARGLVIPSNRGCTSTGRAGYSARRRLPADDDGPEEPPSGCAILCETELGRCLDWGEEAPFWCWLDYKLCMWNCTDPDDDEVFA